MTWQDYAGLLATYPWEDKQASKMYQIMRKLCEEQQGYSPESFSVWAMHSNVVLPDWVYNTNAIYDVWDTHYRMCLHYAFGDDAEKKLEEAKKLLKDPSKKDQGMQLIQSIEPPLVEKPDSMKLADVISRTLEATERDVLSLPTGLVDLDEYMYFEPGGLYFIGARPGVGKTTVALNMATNLAYREKKRVLYLSTEMDDVALSRRILARYTQIPYQSFLQPLTPTQKQRVTTYQQMVEALDRSCNSALFTEPVRSCDIEQLKRIIQYHVLVNQVQYVFLDYIGHITAPGKTEYEQATLRSNEIRKCTAQLGIVTVALMQLNRQADGKEEFSMSMARSSGQQEADAHGMIFLKKGVQEDAEGEEIVKSTFRKNIAQVWKKTSSVDGVGSNEIGLDILKNRNGRLGAFTQLYIPEHFFVGGRAEYAKYEKMEQQMSKL